MIQYILNEFTSHCIRNAQENEAMFVSIKQWIVDNFRLEEPFFNEQNKQVFINMFSEPGVSIPRPAVEIWNDIAGCGENKGSYMDIFGTIFGSVQFEQVEPLGEVDPVMPE